MLERTLARAPGLTLLLLLACGQEAAPAAPGPRLVLREASLTLGEGRPGGPTVLHAARATLDDEGLGQGEQVVAQMPPPGDPAPAGGGKAPPPMQIEAPASDWNLKTRNVRFTGGVVVTRGDVVMRCAELEVRYADADTVDQAIARGDVVVEKGERRATGTEAVLTAADGRIVLTGEPTVTEGPNRLSGQRIELFLDDERLSCQACRLVVAGEALGRVP